MSDSKALCDALCHVLGNTCRILRTARSYNWNASGRGSTLARYCFREQTDELYASIDPIACHIVGLGQAAILDYSDSVVEVNPPTAATIPCLSEMVLNLADGHTQANHSIAAAIDIAREIDEISTAHILAVRMQVHRDWRHRLQLISHEL